MKQSVEVREHGDLHDLVVAAEHGDEITLTRNGKIVARLVKAQPGTDKDRSRLAMDRIMQIGAQLTLGPDLTIRELIDDGRKH